MNTEHTNQSTAPEPFGYFKAEPFGWTDCEKGDEGAIALYERPQAQPVARDVLMAALDDLDNAVVENHGIGMPYKLRQEIADRYAAQHPAVSVPDGWKLVPVEPTEEMMASVLEAPPVEENDGTGFRASFRRTYRAMLAAAPQAAVPDEVAKDAARYRWLRQDESEFSSMAPAELDAAIDKAISAAQKGGAA